MGDAEKFKQAMFGTKKEPEPPKATTTTTTPKTPKPKTPKPKSIYMEELLEMIYNLDTSIINDGQMKNHAEKGIEMLKSFGKNPGFQANRIKGILTLLLKHNKIRL